MVEESKYSERLKKIENKLTALIEVYRKTKSELAASIKENGVLKKEVELKKQELDDFKNQQKISKIVNAISEGEASSNNSELKLKINAYLKEIDKCIAHLERIS